MTQLSLLNILPSGDNPIEKHPIISFIILTFVFSGIFWALIVLGQIKNPYYATLISIIGGYGPAIAAITVSRFVNSKNTRINPLKRWGVFIILFCLILPLALFHPYLKLDVSDPVVIGLCGIISAISAFVLSGVLSRKMGVRNLMSSIVKWKINPVWYIIALFTWPVLYFASNVINIIHNGQPITAYTSNLNLEPFYVVIFFLSTLFVTAGVAEEPGWRGFALPQLQKLYNPFIASLIICFIWQIWHIPLYFTGLYPYDIMQIALRIIPIALPGVILFTWLYNRSDSNLLIAVLFHTSLDVSGGIFPLQEGIAELTLNILTIILVVILIFTDKMWKKIPSKDKLT